MSLKDSAYRVMAPESGPCPECEQPIVQDETAVMLEGIEHHLECASKVEKAQRIIRPHGTPLQPGEKHKTARRREALPGIDLTTNEFGDTIDVSTVTE